MNHVVSAVTLMGALALPVPPVAADPLPNVKMPTLGGKQFWQDTFVHAGWRIQENVITGHSRLLDTEDVRMAWGSYAECRAAFDRLRATGAIRPANRHLVILLHGILRSTGTFTAMREALRRAGYDVAALSYPSTRRRIESHAEALAVLLDRLEGTESVSFVTHSMGGLVLRHLLAGDHAWKRKLKLGRAVLIAPPNQGSAIAKFVREMPWYRGVYGQAGQQLAPDAVLRMPPLDALPFMVIAGGRGDDEGYNPLLDGDDDGTVTVRETDLAGMRRQVVVPSHHWVVASDPGAIRAVLAFLDPPAPRLSGDQP